MKTFKESTSITPKYGKFQLSFHPLGDNPITYHYSHQRRELEKLKKNLARASIEEFKKKENKEQDPSKYFRIGEIKLITYEGDEDTDLNERYLVQV